VLPAEIRDRDWRNLFSGERAVASQCDGRPSLAAATVFAHFPVAVLLSGRDT
jgi:hypothetical protein